VEAYVRYTPHGPILVVHLIVDCRDAMGANAVNTMAETVGPYLEKLTGGKVYLRIISNLADKRLMRARAVFSKEAIGGEDVVDAIIRAYEFALVDPYRRPPTTRASERHFCGHAGNGQRHEGDRGRGARLRVSYGHIPAPDGLREERRRRPDRHHRAPACRGPCRRRHRVPSHREG